LPQRPADECPYARPFREDFDDCPAYRPAEFIGLDLQYRPLPTVWTCGNLDVKASTSGTQGFYARCRLGDYEARLRWVAEVKLPRLERMRELQRSMGEFLRPHLAKLWAVKGAQLRAMRARQDAGELTHQLERETAEVLAQCRRFLEQNSDLLRAVDLPMDVCMEVLEAAFADFVQQPTTAATWRIPDHVLARFPEEIRVFFNPEQLAS
jgi:hypothetical protein